MARTAIVGIALAPKTPERTHLISRQRANAHRSVAARDAEGSSCSFAEKDRATPYTGTCRPIASVAGQAGVPAGQAGVPQEHA